MFISVYVRAALAARAAVCFAPTYGPQLRCVRETPPGGRSLDRCLCLRVGMFKGYFVSYDIYF